MTELFAGRFEILEPIAEGGMGSVWTARDHKHGTMVAVKLLRQADAGSLMRFMREQGTRIEHDHIITPISWAGEDDKVLFSMPLVTGGSVATLLGDYGRLTPAFTAEVLRQLLCALQAVHEAGVVHRDVKPGNLLLDPTGTGRPNVWLTDFGVATPVDAPRLTQVSHVIGTPGYLAPELLEHADPAPAQDLYAVGMMGGQLLTGERPAMGDRFDRYTRPDDVPGALWSALAALAAPAVAGRPGSAAEALRLLGDPSLAWPAAGQEEIEVFEQVQAGTGLSGRTEEFRPEKTGRIRVTPPPASPAQLAGEGATRLTDAETAGVDMTTYQAQRAAEALPSSKRRAGAPFAALVVFLGALLLGLAVVMAWHPWKDVPEDGSVPFEPKPAPSPHTPGAPNVGDSCEWNVVGTETTSTDDTVIRCTATKDGYKWLNVQWEGEGKK